MATLIDKPEQQQRLYLRDDDLDDVDAMSDQRSVPSDDDFASSLARHHRQQRVWFEADQAAAERDTLQLGCVPQDVVQRWRVWWQSQLANVLYILGWYTLSTFLSLYNKWLFDPKRYGFHYPLYTTSMHQMVQFVLAFLCLRIWPHLQMRHRMTPREFTQRVVPCGVTTGLDIGLSNSSLKTITLSFYTMCKSSSLAFVLLFAFVFRLEKPSIALVGVIAVISVGVLLMVSDEADFVLIGFIQVMLASVMCGIRWSLTQMLLRAPHAPPTASTVEDAQHKGTTRSSTDTMRPPRTPTTSSPTRQHPIASIMLLSPVMAICLLLVAILTEHSMFSSPFFAAPSIALHTLALMSVGGVMAFAMVVCEFLVIHRIGVVTLSVCGILKEVLTILVSMAIFGDKLSLLNVFGLMVTLVGIGSYNWLKVRQQAADDAAAYMEGYRQVVERSFGEDAVYFAAAEAFDNSDDEDYADEEIMTHGKEEQQTSTDRWSEPHNAMELQASAVAAT